MANEVDELRRILLSRQLQEVFKSEQGRPGSAPPQNNVDDPGSPLASALAGNAVPNEFHAMFVGNPGYGHSEESDGGDGAGAEERCVLQAPPSSE